MRDDEILWIDPGPEGGRPTLGGRWHRLQELLDRYGEAAARCRAELERRGRPSAALDAALASHRQAIGLLRSLLRCRGIEPSAYVDRPGDAAPAGGPSAAALARREGELVGSLESALASPVLDSETKTLIRSRLLPAARTAARQTADLARENVRLESHLKEEN